MQTRKMQKIERFFFCIFNDENSKSVHSFQTFQVVKWMHYGELAAEPNLFVYNAL